MALEVDFIPISEAAERLDMPQPTLRYWCDKLEELGIHFMERNNRDERVFFDIDMEIFKFIKEQKERYGRKAKIIDIAYMVQDNFECRNIGTRPDLPRRPMPQPADVEALVHSELFQNSMKAIIKEATEETAKRVAERIQEENMKTQKETMQKLDELMNIMKDLNELNQEMQEIKREQEELNKPWYKRMFSLKKDPE